VPKIAEPLQGTEADLIAFLRLPATPWSKLRSTNPLEQVNREVGRSSEVVGAFPNDASAIRLAVEQTTRAGQPAQPL
jgi:putative transposase